jgi:hypothetical protein
VAAGCELEARERVDGDGIHLDAADVADGDLGIARSQQVAHAVGETGKVLARDRPLDAERERA